MKPQFCKGLTHLPYCITPTHIIIKRSCFQWKGGYFAAHAQIHKWWAFIRKARVLCEKRPPTQHYPLSVPELTTNRRNTVYPNGSGSVLLTATAWHQRTEVRLSLFAQHSWSSASNRSLTFHPVRLSFKLCQHPVPYTALPSTTDHTVKTRYGVLLGVCSGIRDYPDHNISIITLIQVT